MIASGFAILAAGPVAADTIVDDITFVPIGTATTTEPATVPADAVVGRFDDADNVAITSPSRSLQVCGDPAVYTATIDWGDNTTPTNGTIACDTSGTAQFQVTTSVSHIYKDSGTFKVNLSVTDTAAEETSADTDTAQTATAVISDVPLHPGTADNVTGVEGTSSVTVHATFADTNHAYSDSEKVDPGLSATIDWGDGHTSSADIAWNDDETNNVVVSAMHLYDANVPATKAYTVKVTLTDDGNVEAQATDTLSATIADAALTAGASQTLTASPTTGFTAIIGSLTDAAGAQASAADFSASINWGDSTSSAGTVAKTASGTFSVSGTHTYVSGGTKAITATVTDEEGSTVTLHATANVVVLPTTGQPHQPAAPAWPLALTLLLLFGLLAMAGGVAMNRFDRIRH